MLSLALSDGEATNRVADLAMQTNIWNVVFLVILGPIFEEWMFRKQLIDHTRKYGEKTAILLSGLAFGLFHMNLFQFFYAFLLGVMFGYIYMRTSKLRYSTAMHMIINFNGGVLAPWILTRVDLDQLDKVSQAAENGNVAAMEQWASQNATGLAIMLVYFLLYGAMVLVGFVLLIRNFRKAEFYTAPEELPRGVRAKTVYGQRRHDHVHRAHGAADGDQSVPIAAVARIMKAGRGYVPGRPFCCLHSLCCVRCVAHAAAAIRRCRPRGAQDNRHARSTAPPHPPWWTAANRFSRTRKSCRQCRTGVKPLSFTTGLYCGLASPTVACSTVLTMSAFIRSTSTPAFAVNGTDTRHSFDGSSFSSEAVFRMEFGMTISLAVALAHECLTPIVSLTVP